MKLKGMITCLLAASALAGCPGPVPGNDASDTGRADTGTPDIGTTDSGTPDTETPDTGTPDTGTPDTGTPDTGTMDAGGMDATACATWLTLPTFDPSIAVPSDAGTATPRLRLAATGTQNYVCTASTSDAGVADASTSYSWVFVGPVATLKDCNGNSVGTHFAANNVASTPAWMSSDGSQIIGSRVAGNTPNATAIPWLLLSVAMRSGTGVLSNIQYIQRLNTTAGIAPTTACGSANVGTMSNVPYTADYYFY